jgi:hypothetical protein
MHRRGAAAPSLGASLRRERPKSMIAVRQWIGMEFAEGAAGGVFAQYTL